ncbi:Uncharacterised protein [uncultured archaeon]|nr:Uncharacterised protein [uncultured archaeon]
MNLESVLNSPQIELHEIKEEEKDILKILNESRHQDIIKVAKEEGISRLVKNKSVRYWESLKAKVDKYMSSKKARRDPDYLYYQLEFFERTKANEYIINVRKGIREALEYVPSKKQIGKEIGENRMMRVTSKIMDNSDEEEIKKARDKVLKNPTKKEIEVAGKRLYELRLIGIMGVSTELYSKTNQNEDLARAIHVHNTLLKWSDNDFPDMTIEDNLVSLLKLTKRNAIREEYRKTLLKEAQNDFYVGSSFDRMADLFFMTRIKEDKESADKLMEKGIDLIKNNKDTNFGNFTGKFFELYDFTGDKSYLEKFKSMAWIVDGEEYHPHFMGTGSTAISLFHATKDKKYLPEIESYSELMAKKGNFRSAEGIYFMMFENTKEKEYLIKAREMFEKMNNEGTNEKPIISPNEVFGAINSVMSAMNDTRNMVLEETGDAWKKEEVESICPEESYFSELENAVELGIETGVRMRYLKNHVEYPEDLDKIRKNIGMLFEMKMGPHISFFNHLFDLYQITGANEDLSEIRKRLKNYSKGKHGGVEPCELIGTLYRTEEFLEE